MKQTKPNHRTRSLPGFGAKDAELRLECLKLAANLYGQGGSQSVTMAACSFYQFLSVPIPPAKVVLTGT